MLLKKKCNRTFKARAFKDIKRQLKRSQKKYATSPTVALELVLILSEIYTHKRRDMTVVGIPGTLLNADIDEDVIMVM